MAKQWRCAVVGTGVVGEWHVRIASRQLPNATLVGVCDTQPSQSAAALAKNGLETVPAFESLPAMIEAVRPDVVHVCTPSGDHFQPAITAMNAGCNVIVEKPMEIRLDRIDAMIAAAKRNNVKLAGIFQTRWNDANRALKRAADEKRFGTIAWAGCVTPWYRTDQYYRDGGWRGTWAMDGGGAIMNQSVHAVDLLQWIAGPVKTVSAYASSRIHPEIEVEDTLTCALQFENGAFGTIVGTTAIYPGGEVRIEIGGGDGHAVSASGLKAYNFRDKRPEDADLLAGKKTIDAGGGADPKAVGLDQHGLNIAHILDAWEKGEEAETNGPEARKAVAIILAMYESAKKGGVPVAVG